MDNDESETSGMSNIISVCNNSQIPEYPREMNLKSYFREDTQDHDEGLLQDANNTFHGHNFKKKGIIHSKSMVESFVTWLGVDNSNREADKWKEHIRRRRTHNRLVGRYKDDPDDDIFDAIFAQQTPQVSYTTYKSPIIDPLSKHSRNYINRQVSKISMSSISKKMSRTLNPVRIAGKESVFKLAYNGLKNAITPTSIKENLMWPHNRSVTMLQIKNEVQIVSGLLTSITPQIVAAIDEDAFLDDVFFNDCTHSELNSDTPETVFSCKLETNKNNQNEDNFVGMSKIPSSYLAKVKGGRQIGVGLAAFITEAEYRKSRLDSTIKNQMNSLEDHRPYFTFWVTFVQVVCYIFAILAYDLAPFGISNTVVTEDVLMPHLAIESFSYLEESNVWLGLRQADLIHMGAKYAGCMRMDKTIRKYIERDQTYEKTSGCCIRLDGSGCYQTSEDNCSYPFGRGYRKSTITIWKTWKNSTGPFGRNSGSVCHQDPRFCLRPPTPLEQQNWPDDITKWPLCLEAYPHSDLILEDIDHMTCDITGQPCCIGIKGECIITTREVCAFRKGYYHQEAFLCSQVACLEEVCGMIPFFDSDVPDQFYRLFISLFIHAGVIHLLVTIMFQMTVMRDLEKLAGSIRISVIYIVSGIAGSLTSAIFLPYVVEAGPSGSQFGLLSCLFVEVIQNRYILKRPLPALLKLSAILISLFILGLMPMVDNFAHLGGFIFGFLLSFAFLPYITFNVTDEKTKIRLVLSCLCLSVILFAVLLIIFYAVPIYDCSFCHYINCLPLTPSFCNNMRLTAEIS